MWLLKTASFRGGGGGGGEEEGLWIDTSYDIANGRAPFVLKSVTCFYFYEIGFGVYFLSYVLQHQQ
jgi:hypothetical protein